MRSSGAMHDLRNLLEEGRGVLPLRSFHPEARPSIRRGLIRSGMYLVRPGWYATRGACPEVVAAVAAGGALTCTQALNYPEVWRPGTHTGLHVRYRRPTPHPPHVLDHRAPGAPTPVRAAVDDPQLALSCAVKCLDYPDAVALCDSLLRLNYLEPHDVMTALRRAGSIGDRIRPAINPSAESGIETHLRVLLRSMRVPFRTQVMIRDVGRTDALVGDRLVLEADGLEFHSGDHTQRDRQREMRLHQLGFLVMRFSYGQILTQRDQVRDTILGAVRSRQHRWNKRNCLWRQHGLRDPVLGEYHSAPTERWLAVQ